MSVDLDLLKQESTFNLIWTSTTEGDKCNKVTVPANLLKHDRQYLLRIKTNLEDKSFKVIPFRTKEREMYNPPEEEVEDNLIETDENIESDTPPHRTTYRKKTYI